MMVKQTSALTLHQWLLYSLIYDTSWWDWDGRSLEMGQISLLPLKSKGKVLTRLCDKYEQAHLGLHLGSWVVKVAVIGDKWGWHCNKYENLIVTNVLFYV